MKKRVLGLVFQSENDVLTCGATIYGNVLRQAGYEPDIISLANESGMKQLETALKSGEVLFAFGLQGVGSWLSIGPDKLNLWQAAQTPFVALHFDHPSHNPYNHFGQSPYIGYLYHFASHRAARETYLPSPQLSGVTAHCFHTFPPADSPAFADRTIKYLFMKNGASLAETDSFINDLPQQLREGVRDRLHLALQKEGLDLCALVDDMFRAYGADRHKFQIQFWDIVRTMDQHVRRVRAIKMVDWLKHKKDAVIVGDGWDFIDKTDAVATFKPGVPAAETFYLYDQTQFLFNTNPYGPDIVHERVMAGLGKKCCVVSDKNAWLQQQAADASSLCLFDWNEPLDDQILPFLQAPDAAQRAATGYEIAQKLFMPPDPPAMVGFAEEVRRFAETAQERNAAGLPNANAPAGTSL